MVKIQYPVPKQRIQNSKPKRAKTIQVSVQGSQTQSGSTVNHQNVEEKATQSKKSIVESDTETIIPNLAQDLGPKTIDSDVIPCPYVDLTSEPEDETANDTDLAHLPMVESDTETIIPNLAPDLAPETIDLNTFLDICPNSVSALVPSAVLDPFPYPYPYPIPEVPYPIPYVCPNAALGPKEKQPPK